jgi:superfamily I DNA/RNA helicase/mRNA-degrading endonuclease RelE of RelBE toxin-antitoxin system
MEFRIADSFLDSLARLTRDEQKAAKTTSFDLQVNPTQPGLSFHKLDRAHDKRFWSVRVSRDIRLIVHRSDSSLLVCYVGHHDDAYRWAERRKIERHPKTGAAQIVEIRETVREIEIPVYVDAPTPAKPALFSGIADERFFEYGVPEEWLDDVKRADEDTLFELADHLPAEAAEALLELATGGTPQVQALAAESGDPFDHPDALRRFRVIEDVKELERAMDFPWDRWSVFLHPAQLATVTGQFSGPARVSGSAGTGKTIVSLHRAVNVARRYPTSQVLLTTFSVPLARMLRGKLRCLVGEDDDVRSRITVRAIDEIGLELYEEWLGSASVPTPAQFRVLLRAGAAAAGGSTFSHGFLETEWTEVVDAWQLRTWEQYRDVARLGRKTRLGETQRRALWDVFERVQASLEERALVTMPMVFSALTEEIRAGREVPFNFAVIDESQDVDVPQLCFLSALAGDRADGLFFSGDLGQRIFRTPFSWKSLGVDVRGRSAILRINYRTSHQIRRQADRLLPSVITDVDGNAEDRSGTVSVFNGPDPVVQTFDSPGAEAKAVGAWLKGLAGDGIAAHEVSVFVRSEAQLARAREAVHAAGLKAAPPTTDMTPTEGCVTLMLMDLAKGLEFRAVAVMACDDEVIPLQERIQRVADDADLEDVYNTERHLLYVAVTRPRDTLLISGVKPASEFLDDLMELPSGEAN